MEMRKITSTPIEIDMWTWITQLRANLQSQSNHLLCPLPPLLLPLWVQPRSLLLPSLMGMRASDQLPMQMRPPSSGQTYTASTLVCR